MVIGLEVVIVVGSFEYFRQCQLECSAEKASKSHESDIFSYYIVYLFINYKELKKVQSMSGYNRFSVIWVLFTCEVRVRLGTTCFL